MRTLPLLAIAAAALLAGCNSKPSTPEVIDSNPDPMATELANRPAVALPPAIKAEKTLRCKDNSLVYVTFFQGDVLANVRTKEDGTPTRLTAPAKGEPLVADGGWKLTGGPDSITLTAPGKAAQACHE